MILQCEFIESMCYPHKEKQSEFKLSTEKLVGFG